MFAKYVTRTWAAVSMLGLVFAVAAPDAAGASDFSGMANVAIAIFAMIGVGALVLGFVTTAILWWLTKRKWVWFLLPLVALGWGLLIFQVMTLFR